MWSVENQGRLAVWQFSGDLYYAEEPFCGRTFLADFPLALYFETYDFVKFGKHCNGDALIAYDMSTFEQGLIFWTQSNSDEAAQDSMRDTVLSKIKELLSQLVKGDVLNLYLIGHENETGVALGSKILYWEGLLTMLEVFRCEAQVNIFVQSCRSGALIKVLECQSDALLLCNASAQADQSSYPDKRSTSGRYRNSPFIFAFRKSLKFCFEPESVAWTLSGHNCLLSRKGGTSGKTQPANITTLNLQTALNQVMFAEMNCRATISPPIIRRILTPPHNLIPSSVSAPRSEPVQQESLNMVVRACETEFDLVGEHHLELDIPVITPVYSAPYRFTHNQVGSKQLAKEIIEVLHTLRWRCSVQVTILRFATAITKSMQRSRLDKLKPISWNSQPLYIGVFISFLEIFPVLQSCTSFTGEGLTGCFPAPVCWLAVILVRFKLRPLDMLVLLSENGSFGPFDFALLKERMGVFAGSKLRPNEMTAKYASEHLPQVMFWLPEGIETEEQMRIHTAEVEERFSRLESIYEHFEGLGSWGISNPATELAEWI